MVSGIVMKSNSIEQNFSWDTNMNICWEKKNGGSLSEFEPMNLALFWQSELQFCAAVAPEETVGAKAPHQGTLVPLLGKINNLSGNCCQLLNDNIFCTNYEYLLLI